MRRSRLNPAGQRGWTLIELAATLAVIGVLTTLAGSSLDGLTSRLLLRSASLTLTQAMRTARHHAMAEGRAYAVVFDAADRYRIIGGPSTRVVELPARVRFGAAADALGPPSNPTTPPPAAGVTFRQSMVTFLADGTLSPGPGTIYLTSRSDHKGSDPSTAAISVTISGHLRRYLWEDRRWNAM